MAVSIHSMYRRSFNVKTWKTFSIVAAMLVVVLGSSHADAGLFGCCGKDRCPPPPKVEICLMICSPCDGCPVPVTLCVPECCVCEVPDVSTRCALIGSGVTHVDYCCCGFSATIRWDRCGEPHVVRTRDWSNYFRIAGNTTENSFFSFYRSGETVSLLEFVVHMVLNPFSHDACFSV